MAACPVPSLLGNGDKLIEIVYGDDGDERKEILCIGQTTAVKKGQKSLVPARRAQPTNQVKTPYI